MHKENPPNIVLGHEFAGEVVVVQTEKKSEWLGKRVVPICSKACGACDMCKTNRAHLCEHTIHMGHGQGWGTQSYYPGAYAEYVPVWAEGCYEIASNNTFEEAAMMDVLAVCTHAYNRANNETEMPILIMGCGPIGNGIAQVARNSGVSAENIVILENSEIAMDIARKNGFQNIYDSHNDNVKGIIEQILKTTKFKTFYSIFDSIGTKVSFQLGLKLLDKGGTYVNLAVHQTQINFDQLQLSGEKRLTASSNFTLADYECTLKWLEEGRFDVKPWLTKISLQEVPKYFEDTIKNKKGRDYFKLVIQTE
jgi:threonine dehydrogenase-like Zn-dependent dehydrogenase